MFKSICDKQSHFLLPVTYFITILFGSSGNIHYICNTKVIIFSTLVSWKSQVVTTKILGLSY